MRVESPDSQGGWVHETLERLSKNEAITLILGLAAQTVALTERVAAWKPRLDIRSVIETARRRYIRTIDAIRLTLKGEALDPRRPTPA